MRTKQELYQAALRTVALRRQTARANAEDARLEAEAAIPALRHAEDEVRVRGIRCALAGAAGKDRTEAAAALSKARQELTALLSASGRPADALEPKFTCKLCQDTGSVQGRTCTCVHKLMQGLRREEIEALSSLSISSFDTMELRYYPNTMDEKLGEPVRTYMGGLLEDLRSYAEEFDHNSESLMLFGNAGLGKTHAALAIAGIVLQKDFDVIYVSSPDFFGKLENARFDSSEDAETLLRTASAADLLMAAAKNAAKQGKKFLADLKDDSEESGAEGVPAAPAPAVETPEGEDGEKNDTPEARMTNARSMVADLLGKKKEG